MVISIWCSMYICVWICLSLVWAYFFYDLIKGLVYTIELGFFSFICAYSLKICLLVFFTWVLCSIPVCSFMWVVFFFHIPCESVLDALHCLWVIIFSIHKIARVILLVELSFEFCSWAMDFQFHLCFSLGAPVFLSPIAFCSQVLQCLCHFHQPYVFVDIIQVFILLKLVFLDSLSCFLESSSKSKFFDEAHNCSFTACVLRFI